MRKFAVVLCILILPAALVAQAAQHTVPKYLQIIREEVKVGKGAAHEKYETSWTQALVRAKFTTPMLAMNSVTGSSEAIFISGYDSLAAYEADAKMMENSPALQAVMNQYSPGDAEYVNGGRTQIAMFREDLSYNVGIKLGEMRYFQIRTVRVRPGHDGEYAEVRKMINAAREKSHSPVHSAVFQVITGAPNGTYLVFTPIKSLADADPVGNPAIAAALGSDGEAKLMDLVNKSVISSEDQIYAFSPKMSNPAPQTVAEDPGFWKPKPAAPVAAARPAGAAATPKKPQ